MEDWQIEVLAQEVLDAYRQNEPPVDLELLAREERIELIEGDFPDEFHGQIEYIREFGKFVIYYPRLATARSRGRVRFSICHEFGHYFIEQHRRMLVSGLTHQSEGFRTKSPVERQADRFASALLFPKRAVEQRMGKDGVLTLGRILDLANRCEGSAQAAAFRYVTLAEEPCIAVVSRGRDVQYSFHSDEAKARGFGFFGNKLVPHACPAARTLGQPPGAIIEGPVSSFDWFSSRRQTADMWEEAVRLGKGETILSILSWRHYTASSDDEGS
ncbi:MAG TPA: ImmA/IrrE family metallo-endopeptidase [Candidatus Acidoferrum sp.]|nr:ImmA/IrrE family metallo-endopeptidase [Candidatus Acidoferrum sp.]